MITDKTLLTFPILRYFAYTHLPPKLQEVSKPFRDLAEQMCELYQDQNTAECGGRRCQNMQIRGG